MIIMPLVFSLRRRLNFLSINGRLGIILGVSLAYGPFHLRLGCALNPQEGLHEEKLEGLAGLQRGVGVASLAIMRKALWKHGSLRPFQVIPHSVTGEEAGQEPPHEGINGPKNKESLCCVSHAPFKVHSGG